MAAIEDYDRRTIMDENVNWMKLTHLLSIFFSTLAPPPNVHLPLLQKKNIIAFLDVHTREI